MDICVIWELNVNNQANNTTKCMSLDTKAHTTLISFWKPLWLSTWASPTCPSPQHGEPWCVPCRVSLSLLDPKCGPCFPHASGNFPSSLLGFDPGWSHLLLLITEFLGDLALLRIPIPRYFVCNLSIELVNNGTNLPWFSSTHWGLDVCNTFRISESSHSFLSIRIGLKNVETKIEAKRGIF